MLNTVFDPGEYTWTATVVLGPDNPGWNDTRTVTGPITVRRRQPGDQIIDNVRRALMARYHVNELTVTRFGVTR